MFFFSHWLILIKGSQSIFCLSASSFPIGQSIKIGIIISGHWLIVIQWPTINLVHFSSSVRLLSLFLLFKPTPSPSSMSSLFLYYGCLSSNCICLCLLQKRTDRGDREKYIRWRQLCWSGEIRFGAEVSERRELVWKRRRLRWDNEVEEEEEPTAQGVEQAQVMAADNRTIKELSASTLDNTAPLCIQYPRVAEW